MNSISREGMTMKCALTVMMMMKWAVAIRIGTIAII